MLLASEYVLAGATLVIGATTGLVALRDAGNAQLADTANAIRSVDPSYAFKGNQLGNGQAWTAGSSFIRQPPVLVTLTPMDVGQVPAPGVANLSSLPQTQTSTTAQQQGLPGRTTSPGAGFVAPAHR